MNFFERIKRSLRSLLYPRRFDVTFIHPITMERASIDFTALDKGEMTGRFAGPCKEEIILTKEDFERMFPKNKGRKTKVLTQPTGISPAVMTQLVMIQQKILKNNF